MTDQSNKIKKFSLYYRFKIDDENPVYNNIDCLTNPFTENSHTVLPLTYGPERQMEFIGNGIDNIISYHSVRIPVTNSLATVPSPMYKEFLHINQPDGTLNAYSIYPDSDSGDATSADKTSWTILGASGIYSNIKLATITYDNEGNLFGYRFSRKIDLFEIPDTSSPAEPTGPSIPSIPSVPTGPSIPSIPTVPSIPSVPTVPNVPSIPSVPTVPNVPNVPSIPSVPTIPSIPSSNERCCEDLELLKNEVRVLVNIVKKDLSRKKK